MPRPFKTTTALVTSLSMVLQSLPVAAQEAAAPMVCADGSQQPCADGAAPIPAAPAPQADEAPPAPAPEPAAEPSAGAAPEPAAAPEAAAAPEPEPAPEPAPAPEPVPEAAPAPAPEPNAQPQAQVAPEPGPEAAPSTVPEAAPAVTSSDPAPTTSPDAAPADEAPDAPATVVEPAQTPQAAPALDTATEAQPTEAPAATAAPAAPEPTPAEPAATEPAATEPTAADPAPATETPAPTASQATTPADAPPADTTPDADALAKALADKAAATDDAARPAADPAAATAEVPPLPVQPDAASGAAPVAAAATLTQAPEAGGTPPAATAPAPDAAVAQVTEETVTTDTARKSTEDFANKVNQAPAAAAASGTNTAVTGAIGAIVSPPAPVVVERKKRLSDVEKLLLLGAGALVVGAILSNNRKVELNSGDRVVVRRGDTYTIIKDDDALLRQPGARIRTETFTDGSTRSTVLREDGSRIVTIRDAEMRVLRRVHVAPDGYETMLIDDTVAYQPVDVRRLPKPRPRPVLTSADDDAALRAALDQTTDAGRRFSLAQVRDIAEVRALAPEIDLTAITFASGSAAIRPDQARALSGLGKLIQAYVRDNPREVFLIEGHTDAVGSAAYNLALSDRRAESVALALTEYFAVPPENMVVQGYGERFLKVNSQGDEQANRRTAVRRITGLLGQGR